MHLQRHASSSVHTNLLCGCGIAFPGTDALVSGLKPHAANVHNVLPNELRVRAALRKRRRLYQFSLKEAFWGVGTIRKKNFLESLDTFHRCMLYKSKKSEEGKLLALN
jgi:hypothetical protein